MNEKIRIRRKRFWTHIMAVLIGILPTMEVWAATYNVIEQYLIVLTKRRSWMLQYLRFALAMSGPGITWTEAQW